MKKKVAGKKTAGKKRRVAKKYLPSVEEQLRPGMPAADSVQKVIDAESPSGAKFQILRTNERDAYDAPPRAKRARHK